MVRIRKKNILKTIDGIKESINQSMLDFLALPEILRAKREVVRERIRKENQEKKNRKRNHARKD